jgi:hypothetical protein
MTRCCTRTPSQTVFFRCAQTACWTVFLNWSLHEARDDPTNPSTVGAQFIAPCSRLTAVCGNIDAHSDARGRTRHAVSLMRTMFDACVSPMRTWGLRPCEQCSTHDVRPYTNASSNFTSTLTAVKGRNKLRPYGHMSRFYKREIRNRQGSRDAVSNTQSSKNDFSRRTVKNRNPRVRQKRTRLKLRSARFQRATSPAFWPAWWPLQPARPEQQS